MKRDPKIILWRNDSRRYRFKLCASNGKPICYSQQEYRTKDAAIAGIRVLVSAAAWFERNADRLKTVETAPGRQSPGRAAVGASSAD
jgi:uncharacterized protein YegP (UPF0339 family)